MIWLESSSGNAIDQDSCGWIGMFWSQHMSRWFSLRKWVVEMSTCSDGSPHVWRMGGGVYIASTQNLTITHKFSNSVRPILVISFPESWLGKLSGTDLLFLVRPKCYKRETESLHCNLGGTDRSSQWDRNVTKGNREITTPSRWDQDPYQRDRFA